jgi:predicted nucleic acid-binding protein
VATAYFLDSSVLVKRYVQETGTAWVRRLTRRSAGNRIYLARITAVEVTAAVARRRKGKTLTSKKASSILHRFRQHLAGRYTLIDIAPALLDDAMRLANAHASRLTRLRRRATGRRPQNPPGAPGLRLPPGDADLRRPGPQRSRHGRGADRRRSAFPSVAAHANQTFVFFTLGEADPSLFVARTHATHRCRLDEFFRSGNEFPLSPSVSVHLFGQE